MQGETNEEVVERAERLYEEGHISSGRLRAIKNRVERGRYSDAPSMRDKASVATGERVYA